MTSRAILLIEDNADDETLILTSSKEAHGSLFTAFADAVRQLGLSWLVLNDSPLERAGK